MLFARILSGGKRGGRSAKSKYSCRRTVRMEGDTLHAKEQNPGPSISAVLVTTVRVASSIASTQQISRRPAACSSGPELIHAGRLELFWDE